MNTDRTARASAACRLRAVLLSGASAAALALAMLPGMGGVALALGEDTGDPTMAEIELALTAIAGSDGLLDGNDIRTWVASLPAHQQPPSSIIDRFIGTLQPTSGGEYSVPAVIDGLLHFGDDPDGSDDPNLMTGNGSPSDRPVCRFWQLNATVCRQMFTGQLTLSVDRPGSAVYVNNATDITTTGSFQPGIVLQIRPYYPTPTVQGTANYDHPAMILDNAGNISTSGAGSSGISAWGGNGSVRIGNIGDITTSGQHAFGIAAFTGLPYHIYGVTSGGDITIVNTGNINVGAESAGIFAESGFSTGIGSTLAPIPGGDITIANTGNIQSGGWASISARSAGGDISVTNSGALSGGG